MLTLDPGWLKKGSFDLSADATPSRTQQIRDALSALEGHPLRLVKHDSYGHASGYYIREERDGEPMAQYVMAIDSVRASLSLGISIEKGEEGRSAAPGRRMSRATWDWPRLAALRAPALKKMLEMIARKIRRPMGIWVSTHLREGAEETAREECEYVVLGGDCFLRARPSSVAELVDKLQDIDGRKNWWADHGGAPCPAMVGRRLVLLRFRRFRRR